MDTPSAWKYAWSCRVDLSRNAHKVFAWLWRQPRFESTHEGECDEKCNWWDGYAFAPLGRLCDSFDRQGITEDEILDALDELESAGAIHRVHIAGRYPKRVWLRRKCCKPQSGMYKRNPVRSDSKQKPNQRQTPPITEHQVGGSAARPAWPPRKGAARFPVAPPPGGGGSAGPDPTGSVKPVSSEGGNMPSEQDIFEKALRKRPVRSGSGTPSVIEGHRLTRGTSKARWTQREVDKWTPADLVSYYLHLYNVTRAGYAEHNQWVQVVDPVNQGALAKKFSVALKNGTAPKALARSLEIFWLQYAYGERSDPVPLVPWKSYLAQMGTMVERALRDRAFLTEDWETSYSDPRLGESFTKEEMREKFT